MQNKTDWKAAQFKKDWVVTDKYDTIVAWCSDQQTAELIAHNHNAMVKYVEQCINLSGVYVPSERAVRYRVGVYDEHSFTYQ